MRPVRQALPPAFGDGRPQEIRPAPGPVTIMVKRISEYDSSNLSQRFRT
jgi:hypothetical protein